MKTIFRLVTFLAVAFAAGLPAQADVDRVPMSSVPHHPRVHGDNDWVPLASPTPTRYGTEYIVVGRQTGWFRTIRIEAMSGRVFVRKLDLYAGPARNTFRVDTMLDARHPVVYVDLGRLWRIDQLAITTARYPAGSYAVQGSSGGIPRSRMVSQR